MHYKIIYIQTLTNFRGKILYPELYLCLQRWGSPRFLTGMGGCLTGIGGYSLTWVVIASMAWVIASLAWVVASLA
jgi:hypothetical protein